MRDGKIVAVFSLEMSKESLLRRMLASQALVSMQKIQTGFIPKADRGKLMEALERLAESKIFIDDTPAIALSEMRAKARRLQRQQGALDLIVIDYLQLMSASSFGVGARRYENRTQEVSAISAGSRRWRRNCGYRWWRFPSSAALRNNAAGTEADAFRSARIGLD